MISKYVALVIAAASSLACSGCEQPAPISPAASVSGRVTLDGTPMASGTVKFIPIGAKEGITVPIENGAYRVDRENHLPAGRTRVEVHDEAHRVPARYNAQSKLMNDIMPGENKFDLRLSSKE